VAKTLDPQQIKVRSALPAQYVIANSDPTDPVVTEVCNPDPTDACHVGPCNSDPRDACV
jgi:hypothetical protein